MGILGYIFTALIAFVNGIVTGTLEFLRLHRLAYVTDQTLTGWGTGFVEWEEGINRRFDLIAGEVNQSLDQGSDRLFSDFQTGLEGIQNIAMGIAARGDTMANWISFVNEDLVGELYRMDVPNWVSKIPGVPATDIDPSNFIEGLIGLINGMFFLIEAFITIVLSIPGIIIIPFGIVISGLFSIVAGFFGVAAGFIGYTGALTGIESAFIFIGVLLVVLNIIDTFTSIASLQFFRPASFANDTVDDLVGIVVGFTFVLFHIAPTPIAMMMSLGGIALVLYSASEDDTKAGIYSFTLTGVGTTALWLSVFEFLSGTILIVGTFAVLSVATSYTVMHLKNRPDGSVVTV